MVDFGKTDYFHAMDPPKKIIPVKELSHKDIGISSKMGDVLQGLKSDIIAGASHVEIGFMGQGMVDNLLKKGADLTVYNRTQSKVQAMVD